MPPAPVSPLNGGTLLTSPSFVDNTAVNGQTYDYTVTAVDAAGQESGPSTAVPGTPDGPPPPNTAPVVDSVTISPASPTTNQTLTAAVTSHDAEGGPLTTTYQWTRNGTDIAGATGATLNLAVGGNGDKADLIAVRATVSDGLLSSAPLTLVGHQQRPGHRQPRRLPGDEPPLSGVGLSALSWAIGRR